MRSAVLLFVLCTALQPVAAQPRLVADLVPGEEGAEPQGFVVHDGVLAFVPTAMGLGAFYTYDPATAQTTAHAYGSAMEWVGSVWPFGTAVYLVGGSGEATDLYTYERASGAPRRVDALAQGTYGANPESFVAVGGYGYFTALANTHADDLSRPLYSVAQDGSVTRLLPASAHGVATQVTAVVPFGDGVAFLVTAEQGEKTVGEVWRARLGAAERLAGLPDDAGWLSLAATGEALLVGTTDPQSRASVLYRYSAAGVLQPVTGFRGSDLAYHTLVAFGDHYVYTQLGEADGRVHLWYGTGDAPAAQIPDLDLGAPGTYRTGALRRDGSTVYTWGFEPGDDPHGSQRSFYAINLTTGQARRQARLDGDDLLMNPADYAVVGDTLYFTAYREGVGAELFALPLAR